MRSRHEFEEDHGVHRYVATSGGSNDGPHHADADEIVKSSNCCPKYGSDENSRIESWLSAYKIRRDAPERRANDESYIVCDRSGRDVRNIGHFQ